MFRAGDFALDALPWGIRTLCVKLRGLGDVRVRWFSYHPPCLTDLARKFALTQIRAQSHWAQAHRRHDDAARARLRRTLHLPRVRVEGKGTPGIGGEGGARARPEPPPCPLLLRARRRWRGMRFGCCAPGTGERIDHCERRADRRSGFRSAEGVSLGRTAAVWSSGEPSNW